MTSFWMKAFFLLNFRFKGIWISIEYGFNGLLSFFIVLCIWAFEAITLRPTDSTKSKTIAVKLKTFWLFTVAGIFATILNSWFSSHWLVARINKIMGNMWSTWCLEYLMMIVIIRASLVNHLMILLHPFIFLLLFTLFQRILVSITILLATTLH